MKIKYITAALAAVAVFSAHSLRANNIAYLGVNNGDFGTLDLGTGNSTILGNSGQTLAGLAVSNAKLYATSYHVAAGSLFTVNPANGSLTTVGSSGITYDDFGSTTSGLFAVDTSANLYSVNQATGVATLVGSTGLSFGTWRGLSNNSSTLYFADGASLYTLNTATGAATLIGSTGGPQFGAMLMEGGILYGGENTPGLRVDMLNPANGVATTGPSLVGSSSPFYGLAPNPIPVPEPNALALLGAAILCLCSKRRTRNA